MAKIRPSALVTGASSGIGYELAKQFSQHGFDLIVVSAGDRMAGKDRAGQAAPQSAGHPPAAKK